MNVPNNAVLSRFAHPPPRVSRDYPPSVNFFLARTLPAGSRQYAAAGCASLLRLKANPVIVNIGGSQNSALSA